MLAIDEKLGTARLIERRRWTPRHLSFRLTRDPAYRFVPGQFARLGLRKPNGSPVWRAYSIASAPWDEHLEFYSIIVPGGQFTPQLDALEPGDEIMIERAAYGFLTTSRFADGRDLWMLATGTGLAPFLSILQDEDTWRRFERLVLVHGVRESAELAYREEIDALRRHPLWADVGGRLAYQAVLSRDDSPTALAGRIPALLDDGSLEARLGLRINPEYSRLMVCGSPDMVRDTHRALIAKGCRLSRLAAPAQIAVENGW
ncbi:ferredoxin--NADP reductase [Aromatoleum petrolei]|uniref:ferredoxin--NADP(+) reductase n=1 Tax=Aromatoleum petrolei TaxID=76116 RepID=A0ABX1MR45_9RHOO|nr:ferredoxin--NADP reductase [Aromatoleum petrolei]NMF89098.1 ferredoxin--NADP reductase [Aromatoleum petrolei]QTQ38310.1 Ferredoxin--NADP reductase [Aromatoleum petrolei]